MGGWISVLGNIEMNEADGLAKTTGPARGLVIVITGEGKGKTTSALGMLMRARGHNQRTAILQFVKSPESECGELQSASLLGIEMLTGGAGFTWVGQNEEKNRIQSIEVWNQAREKINSGKYDMIVLDEFTYAFKYHWLQINEVIEVLNNRPSNLHIIITGRDAPAELIDFADAAMEIVQIKHHLKKGIKAQPGIEF
jgi:cob(I)alamin adenosyltransferase